MTNYLILSEDEITIKSNIDKIIKESKFKDYELIKYDLTVNSINEVLEELDTYNFLTTNKIIVLYNSTCSCSFSKGVSFSLHSEVSKFNMFIYFNW